VALIALILVGALLPLKYTARMNLPEKGKGQGSGDADGSGPDGPDHRRSD
jgi:hypothetical protein